MKYRTLFNISILNSMQTKPSTLPSIVEVMRTPTTINDSATFRSALESMVEQKTNSVLVLNAAGKLVGEVNVLALIRAVLPDYIEEDDTAAHFATEQILIEDIQRVKDLPVADFMKTEIKTLSANSTFMEAAVIAIAHDQGRIPIVDSSGKPIGVVTRTEIKQIIGSYLGVSGCFEASK